MISMMATQNRRAANPKTAKVLPILSKMESRFTAYSIPSGIPKAKEMINPAKAMCTVAGRRSSSSFPTG